MSFCFGVPAFQETFVLTFKAFSVSLLMPLMKNDVPPSFHLKPPPPEDLPPPAAPLVPPDPFAISIQFYLVKNRLYGWQASRRALAVP